MLLLLSESIELTNSRLERSFNKKNKNYLKEKAITQLFYKYLKKI